MAEIADIAVIDGEDIDDISPWEFDSLVEGGSNTLALSAAAANHGINGYRITYGGDSKQVQGVKSFAAQIDIYNRFYTRFAAGFSLPADGNYIYQIPLLDGADSNFVVYYYWHSASGKLGFKATIRHAGGNVILYDDNVSDIFTVGTWYRIEVRYKSGGIGTGGAELWLDGISLASDYTTWNTSIYNPNGSWIGTNSGSANPAAGKIIDYDDILFSTVPIGPYPLGKITPWLVSSKLAGEPSIEKAGRLLTPIIEVIKGPF